MTATTVCRSFRKGGGDVSRIERLYALNERVRLSRRPVSARELAEEFGVARRTIERDLDTLRRSGAPLYAEFGRRGGARSVAQPDAALVSLRRDELLALLIAASVASGAPFTHAAGRAIAKLTAALDAAHHDHLDDLRERFRIARTGTTVAPRVMSVIEAALLSENAVRITYRDRTGAMSQRIVEPACLYFDARRWSLAAWCRERNGARLFVLDRVAAAHTTKQLVSRRNVDDVLGWVPNPGSKL
jgi:predicted DNA-binding transcriptional regulator YafY